MTLSSAGQLSPLYLSPLGQQRFAGGTPIRISFPVKYVGTVPIDARFVLYIYEGSILPRHGRLIAQYEKAEHFEPEEEKDLVFEHRTVSTMEARRDLGLEAFKNTERVYSGEWNDVYFVTTATEQMMGMVALMIPLALMGMMLPMIIEEVR